MYNDRVDRWESVAAQHIADELAVKNMIETLKLSLYSDEEFEYIKAAIRTHNLMNAERVMNFAQQQEEKSNDR